MSDFWSHAFLCELNNQYWSAADQLRSTLIALEIVKKAASSPDFSTCQSPFAK